MAQESFGKRLAEARRRRGLSLEQVHSQLRITPAILEALEYADFLHMPLKGHARNMVSSYARFLGLNSEEVTKDFLREYHDFENHEARRNSAPFSSLGMGGSSRSSSGKDSTPPPRRRNNSENNRSVRSIWDRSIPNSELSQGFTTNPSTSRRAANAPQGRYVPTRDGRVTSSYGGDSYTAKQSLPMRLFGPLFSSPVVLVVVLIVVLVALLIVWAMIANSCKKQENEITPINTSAVVSDATGINTGGVPTAGDANDETSKLYGPFELAISPAPGEAPWVEVIVDGQTVFADILSERKTWPVNARCEVNTAQPDNLKVTRNGQEVTLTVDEDTYMGSTIQEVIERPADTGADATAAGAGTGDANAAGQAGDSTATP